MKINTIKNYAIAGLLGISSGAGFYMGLSKGIDLLKPKDTYTLYLERKAQTDSFEQTKNDSTSKDAAANTEYTRKLNNFGMAKKYIEQKLNIISKQYNVACFIDHPYEYNQVLMLKDHISKQNFKGKKEMLEYINAIIMDYDSKGCHSKSFRYDGTESDNYNNYRLQIQGYDMEGACSIRGTELDCKKW